MKIWYREKIGKVMEDIKLNDKAAVAHKMDSLSYSESCSV